MADSVKQTLLAAFRVLMGPLVRILLRQGISFAEFSEVAKAVYVEVAVKDFKVAGRKATRTRIAVMTGLTRKEVKRVIDEAVKERYELKTNYNRLGRVLVGWHTDSDFTGPYGLPLELRYESQDPDELTFSVLVRRHSGDMSPRSILDELIRVGAIREADSGWFRVLRREYIPEAQGVHNFERTGGVIRNFINTIDFNMTKTAPGRGRFERQAVADDGIRLEDMPKFDAYLRERSQALLEEIDNWLTNLPKPDPDKGDEVVRTGLGIYHYQSNYLDDRTFKQILTDEGLIRGHASKHVED
ncbi:MAG: hypothetical protein HKN35_00120 [Woeseia sp.]|nr:hypothetical protein [Woeseia sp.]